MKKILILSASAMMLLAACAVNEGAKLVDENPPYSMKEVSSEEIGLRKVNLDNENNINLIEVNFTSSQPGASDRFERSFENAPPLIPHTVEDLLPITKDNNSCLSCHDKAVAKDMGATPLPPSHYYDFRNNKSTGDVISDTRFNCTQCHVPQSDAKPLVGNNFKPEFKNQQLKQGSNLIEVINEGVK